MDPMTIIVAVGFAVVAVEALLTAAVYRKALRGGERHPTVSTDVVCESTTLSDLRRQRLRMMRSLRTGDERGAAPVPAVAGMVVPTAAIPVELTQAA